MKWFIKEKGMGVWTLIDSGWGPLWTVTKIQNYHDAISGTYANLRAECFLDVLNCNFCVSLQLYTRSAVTGLL
jgi:hypothetical protein